MAELGLAMFLSASVILLLASGMSSATNLEIEVKNVHADHSFQVFDKTWTKYTSGKVTLPGNTAILRLMNSDVILEVTVTAAECKCAFDESWKKITIESILCAIYVVWVIFLWRVHVKFRRAHRRDSQGLHSSKLDGEKTGGKKGGNGSSSRSSHSSENAYEEGDDMVKVTDADGYLAPIRRKPAKDEKPKGPKSKAAADKGAGRTSGKGAQEITYESIRDFPPKNTVDLPTGFLKNELAGPTGPQYSDIEMIDPSAARPPGKAGTDMKRDILYHSYHNPQVLKDEPVKKGSTAARDPANQDRVTQSVTK